MVALFICFIFGSYTCRVKGAAKVLVGRENEHEKLTAYVASRRFKQAAAKESISRSDNRAYCFDFCVLPFALILASYRFYRDSPFRSLTRPSESVKSNTVIE